jgi:hypothetical protein
LEDLNALEVGFGIDSDELDVRFGSHAESWSVHVPLEGGFSGGEDLTLATDNERPLAVGHPKRLGLELWPVADGNAGLFREPSAAVVLFRRGLGRLVLVAAPHAFQNLHVVEADNALLFARLIEHLQAGKDNPPRPLFDESAAHRDDHRTWVTALFVPPLLPATLAVLFAISLWAWSFSARRSFPLDRRLARRPAPAERARALASLVVRARHPGWLTSTSKEPPPETSTADSNHE